MRDAQVCPPGRIAVEHRWKHASILAQAFRHGVPMTVHPGIGYDIIANHPMFNGARHRPGGGRGLPALRRLGRDARRRRRALGRLGHHGAAGLREEPELRQQPAAAGRAAPIVRGHTIYVVDLQDGGGWDWTQGEPPKTNPAYYLRFCKSYSRMGGAMHYLQCDNAAFIHNLYRQLCAA